MNWTTFYGREFKLHELSHQHLSNILWYYDIVMAEEAPTYIKIELITRFGGMRLPYRPMLSFTQEIDFLLDKGYIDGSHDSNVVVNGRWIGALSYN